jgi:hypothetical protein
MKRSNGSIHFSIGNQDYTLNEIDFVFLDEENGEQAINERFIEDCVEILIKDHMKDYHLKGNVHDITLFLEDGSRLAYAENYSKEYGNFKFYKTKIEL